VPASIRRAGCRSARVTGGARKHRVRDVLGNRHSVRASHRAVSLTRRSRTGCPSVFDSSGDVVRFESSQTAPRSENGPRPAALISAAGGGPGQGPARHWYEGVVPKKAQAPDVSDWPAPRRVAPCAAAFSSFVTESAESTFRGGPLSISSNGVQRVTSKHLKSSLFWSFSRSVLGGGTFRIGGWTYQIILVFPHHAM
jgi:hypothetical protein